MNIHEKEDNAGLKITLDVVHGNSLRNIEELDVAEVVLLLGGNWLVNLGVVLDPGLQVGAGFTRHVPSIVRGSLHLLDEDLLGNRGIGVDQLNEDDLEKERARR